MPGRVFFKNRQWPDGYIFPACVECNRATRYEEKVIAFFSRLNSESETTEDIAEFEKMASEVAKHHPEFFSDIRSLTANEVRRFLKDNGIEKPAGITTSDIPIVKLGRVVNNSVRKFGRKLFLALWFKHTGTILPKSGGIRIKWLTNASQSIDDATLATIFQTLSSVPPIIKNSHSLHNQFTYRYAITPAADGAGFLVWFRQSFGLLCTIAIDKSMIRDDPNNIEVPF